MFAHPRNRDRSHEFLFVKRSNARARVSFARLIFAMSSRALRGMLPSLTAILLLVAPARAEETLYGASGSNNRSGLYVVDPNTAAGTFIDAIRTPDFQSLLVTGIAFNPLSGILYGTTTDGRLVTIDPGTAVATVIGSLGKSLRDISFRSDGTLFGFEANDPFSLATINLNTGAATTVGNSGLASTVGGGLAFSPNDTLYLSATGHAGTLDTLNPATGARTIGPILLNSRIGNGEMSALAFNSLGTLFALDNPNQDLVIIDPATGAITDVCSFFDPTDAIAFSPSTLTFTDNQSDANPADRFLDRLPHATKIKATVDFDDTSPGNVVVTLFTPDSFGGVFLATLWDHELLVDENNQPLTHVHAVVNDIPASDSGVGDFGNFCGGGPPVYSYELRVLDDPCQQNESAPVGTGTLKSWSLTLDPVDPGHIAPPTVNLYADSQNHPVPDSIISGSPLTLVATAVGNPSSFPIDRLRISITEITNPDPLMQHQSGNTPESYQSNELHPAPSNTGATLSYTPPTLPPGDYVIRVVAYDSAGFVQTLVKNLTVNRGFGLFSVSNVSRTVRTECPETDPDCSSDVIGDYAFPCNKTDFGATLTLINDTCIDAPNLRVRIVSAAGSAYLEQDCPPDLPDETDLTAQNPPQASVGLVGPLPAHSCETVQISGVAPAPIQNPNLDPRTGCDLGIGFQIYAVLDECVGGDCGDNGPGEWIQVDSIKVTEGEWPIVGGFGGPGGGVNTMRHGRKKKHRSFIFDSVTIDGPDTVPGSTPQQYTAAVIAKNATTTKSIDVTAAPGTQWNASAFTIPGGLFQPGQVSANTQVTLLASYTLGHITKTATKTITVTPTLGSSSVASEAISSIDQAIGPLAKKKHKRGKRARVSVSASPTCINEGGFASFTISASSINPSRPVTVRYAMSGTATLGTDCTLTGTTGQATIPPGASSVRVALNALTNNASPPNPTATLTLRPGPSYKLTKSKTAKAATLTIDNSATTCN